MRTIYWNRTLVAKVAVVPGILFILLILYIYSRTDDAVQLNQAEYARLVVSFVVIISGESKYDLLSLCCHFVCCL